MKVKDAREFGNKLREAHNKASDNRTLREHQEYHEAIHLEMQKRLDSMSEAEVRESGLVGYGYHRKGGGYGKSTGKGGSYRDCGNPRGYHHFW